MAKIYPSISALIGNTPLVALTKLEEAHGLKAHLVAKLESFNPAGSAKDRVALRMICAAEEESRLTPDSTIIEPTSGNTGIGLACVAATRGYRTIIVMPDSMSAERQKLMRAYGAELVLTPGKDGMAGAIAKATELQAQLPNSILAGQFENPANPQAHYDTTGPEIEADTDGKVDVFVAGVGTGGTITGVGRYLKERHKDIQIIAVEPADSPILSGGTAGPHPLQGIGAGFIPSVLDVSVIDEVLTVTGEEAYHAGRVLGKREGILCGISAGAALHAAIEVAKRPENEDKTVVVLLPDTGDRYLSTDLFEA